MEEWRPIEEQPEYEVSSHGRVRGKVARRFKAAGEIVALIPDKDGYLFCHLRKNKRDLVRKAHRLVVLAFCGSPPSSRHVVAHFDGNNQNNDVSNLRWATPPENTKDMIRHKRTLRGERQPTAKLNEGMVESIRTEIAAGVVQRRIAEKYGVCPQTITLIKHSKTWVPFNTDPSAS